MTANQPTRLRAQVDSSSLDDSLVLSTLKNAATLFIKHEESSVKIWAASHDWFLEEWGRDAFVSLPGLLLVTEQYEQARQVFRRYAQMERRGIIPNVIHDNEQLYNTVDASLWFIHALKAYVEETKDWTFMGEMMPIVQSILANYMHGTFYTRGDKQYQILMEKDGLISSPPQATWMDADPSGDGSSPVTPRNGKCVEINALWYGALQFLLDMGKKLHIGMDLHEFEEVKELVRKTYIERFWNRNENCLFDVVDGDEHGDAIRPNQIFAVSHGGDLLNHFQQTQVFEVVTEHLLTNAGLRTLSPRDAMYRGQYDTFAPMSEKDLAYHQGTVWPWLIGPYCDALRIVWKTNGRTEEAIHEKIREVIAPLVQFCIDSDIKSLPEVFSGDEPHEPGGTRSQAWSVAEVMRILERI